VGSKNLALRIWFGIIGLRRTTLAIDDNVLQGAKELVVCEKKTVWLLYESNHQL
jgi:hypothetical protein